MPNRGFGYGGDVADYAMWRGQQGQENWNNIIQLITALIGQKTAKEQWGQEFDFKRSQAETDRQLKEKELGLQGAEIPMKQKYYDALTAERLRPEKPAAVPSDIQEAVLLAQSDGIPLGQALRIIKGRKTPEEIAAEEDTKGRIGAKWRRVTTPTDFEQKMTRLDDDYDKGLISPTEYGLQKKALLSNIRPQTVDPMMLMLMKQLGMDPAQFGMGMSETGTLGGNIDPLVPNRKVTPANALPQEIQDYMNANPTADLKTLLAIYARWNKIKSK